MPVVEIEMMFPKYNFAQLNEADVREEIVAPLLRHLGYRSGTANNVIREQCLAYPKLPLGQKKNSDPLVRGRADYICEANRQVRWTIEAKSPDRPLDEDAQQQSWTYANHPEVRAVYFCLTNGQEFCIYQTDRGPDHDPVFQCSYNELDDKLPILENILSPEALAKNFPEQQVDYGIPIGPGLRSVARITSGSIIYRSNTLGFKPLIGLTTTITEGSVERNEHGLLEAYIQTLVPFQSLQHLNEKLGLHSLRLVTDKAVLSDQTETPTVFQSSTNRILPKGEKVLNLETWTHIHLPMNITATVSTRAEGVLYQNKFSGDFFATLVYHELQRNLHIEGAFHVSLA